MNTAFKKYIFAALLFFCSIGVTNAQTLKTPYGVLSVTNNSDLLIDQKQFSPKVNGGMGIDFVFSTKYGDKFAVLLSMNSGGNACPATYRWVLLTEKSFEASPDFGNCSEEAKGSLVGSDLIVQVPRYGTAPAAKYSFNGSQLKENDKARPEKVVAGNYKAEEIRKPSTPEQEKYFQLGVCYQAAMIATKKNIDTQYIKPLIDRLDAINSEQMKTIRAVCGPTVTLDCVKRLPPKAEAYGLGIGRADEQLTSSAPIKLISGGAPGNSPTAISQTLRAFCSLNF